MSNELTPTAFASVEDLIDSIGKDVGITPVQVRTILASAWPALCVSEAAGLRPMLAKTAGVTEKQASRVIGLAWKSALAVVIRQNKKAKALVDSAYLMHDAA
ncbi:MAG: hypothetical protein P0119_22375 [Nitrospira sp.]|nr:hypothetical protein [Nitrospira sp.]